MMNRFRAFIKDGAQRERDRPPAAHTIVVPFPETILDKIDNLKHHRRRPIDPQPQRDDGLDAIDTGEPTTIATTPESLRRLRDLIRNRHQLDLEIWSLKDVRGPDRPVVQQMMEKADAVLAEIYDIVLSWPEDGGIYDRSVWTEREWKMTQQIKSRILKDGKRWWAGNPPWNDA